MLFVLPKPTAQCRNVLRGGYNIGFAVPYTMSAQLLYWTFALCDNYFFSPFRK
jgi:hypothetical protein